MYTNTEFYNIDDHDQVITDEEKTILIQNGWKEVNLNQRVTDDLPDMWDRWALLYVNTLIFAIKGAYPTPGSYDKRDYRFALWKLDCDPPIEFDTLVYIPDWSEYELPGGIKYHRIYLFAYSRLYVTDMSTVCITYQLHTVLSSDLTPMPHLKEDRTCLGDFPLRIDNIREVPQLLSWSLTTYRTADMSVLDQTIF
jgi:hypothetical protein